MLSLRDQRLQTSHPRILVLDEPTSALDPGAAEEVLAALQRLVHDLGITVVMAEHRLERVVQYADQVLVVSGGQVTTGAPATMMAGAPVAPPVVAPVAPPPSVVDGVPSSLKPFTTKAGTPCKPCTTAIAKRGELCSMHRFL
mgnify:CR=1 FL=1